MNEEQKKLLGQVIQAFSGDTQRLEDLNPEDDLAKRGKQHSDYWTNAVTALSLWPDAHISALGRYVWDVFHNRHVHLIMGPGVKTLHTAIVPPGLLEKLGFPTGPVHQCVVITPPNWIEMIKEDPVMQLGGVLFCSSQATDFYNERHFVDPQELSVRAQMYESRFLGGMPSEKLNDYQKGIVSKFKSQIDPKLAYERKKVEVVS